MKKNKNRHRNILFGAILCTVGTSVSWAETKFTLTADVGATWVDNLDLASDPVPKKSDYVFEVSPGFIFEQKGQRFNGSINYTLQSFFYADNDDRDSVYHQGGLDATLALVQDYFFVEALGNYSQQLIDASVATNNNLLFETLNVTDTLTAQVSPYFRHEFDYVRVDLSYIRGIVRYDVPPDQTDVLEDVDLNSGFASFGSADDQQRLSWEARYENQEADYEVSAPFRFESASGGLGLLLGKTFRVLGRGGIESDILVSTTDGGLDQSYWEAGFRWTPSERTTLEALYGEHSYGETYNIRLEHTAKFLELRGSYAEGPTTQAEEMVLRPSTSPNAQGVDTQDPKGALDPLNPQNTQGANQPNNSINADVYLRQDAEATISFVGHLTRIDINGFDFQRTYISGDRIGSVESTSGFGLAFSRTVTARTKFELGGSYTDSSLTTPITAPVPPTTAFAPTPYQYYDVVANIGLTQTLSEKIFASLTVNRISRTGDIEYTAHWATLLFTGKF